MQKSLTLLFVALLSLGGLAALPTANAVRGDECSSAPCAGIIEFLDFDRQTPSLKTDADTIPELVGTGAVGIVHVFDEDLAASSSITVSVHKRGSTTGAETITLVAEGTAGHFFGTFGVETTDVAGNGRVLVANGDQLAADYVDASPAATITTAGDSLEWITKTSGTIAFSASTYSGAPGFGQVTVTDADKNQDSGTAESVYARVSSTTNQTGVVLNLTETGVNTGIFSSSTGEFGLYFALSAPANGTTLTVANGDALTATYFDALDAAGRVNATRTASATWNKVTNGAIEFTDSTYRLAADPAGYFGVGTGIGFIRLEDPDLAATGSTNVNVKSTASSTGITVSLTRAGDVSGEFVGSFGFIQGASTSTQLQVDSDGGDTITLTYEDARNALGVPQTVTRTIPWTVANTGTIRFPLNDQYPGSNAAGFSNVSNVGFLEVFDPDASAGADTMLVRVTSDEDPVGLVATLLETTSSSGLFRGCFHFNNDSAVGGSVNVTAACTDSNDANGATLAGSVGSAGRLLVRGVTTVVTASYTDAHTADGGVNRTISTSLAMGSSSNVRADPNQSGTGANSSNEPKGTITFLICTANCQTSTPVLAAVPSTGFASLGDPYYAWVRIDDENMDVNATGAASSFQSAPGVNVFNITLSSIGGNLPGSPGSRNLWDSVGNLTSDTGISITVNETDSTSHVFYGHFGFTQAPTSNDSTELLKVGNLTSPFADTVVATYSYANTTQFGVGSSSWVTNTTTLNDKVGLGLVTASSAWRFAANATVKLVKTAVEGADETTHYGVAKSFIRLENADWAQDSTTGLDTVTTVKVTSTSDPTTGISVTLTERYRNAFENTTLGALHNTADDAFVGTFGFTTGDSSDASDLIKVASGDTVTVTYQDLDTSGVSVSRQDTMTWKPSGLATMALVNDSVPDATVIRGNGSTVTVRVTDAEQNTVGSAETVNVTIQGDWNGTIAPHYLPERFNLTLTETTGTSGIFEGSLFVFNATFDNDTGVLVRDGSIVSISYFDANDASGAMQAVTQTLRYVNEASGGILKLNKAAYVGSETATISLWDPNADTTGVADTVKVRVVSESDGVGELITLTETGGATDNFTGTFSFETTRTVGNTNLFVANTDQFAVYYLDCPAVGSTCTAPAGNVSGQSAPRVVRSSWTLTGVFNAPTAGLSANVTSGQVPLAVRFSMTASDSDGSVASYTLGFGDGTASVTGGNPNAQTQDHTYSIAGTYVANLTVTDNAGLTGSASVTITVTSPDTTAPSAITTLAVNGTTLSNAVNLNWTAPGDDAATGTVTAYNITVSTVEITSSNLASIVNPANVTFTFLPTTLVAAGSLQSVTVGGLNASTTYFFAVRGVDEGANKGVASNFVSAKTATPDTTAPVGTLAITSSTHAASTATESDDPIFAWTGLTDAESTITYRFALNQNASYTLGSSDATTANLNTSFANIAAGTWYFHLRGETPGGNSAQGRYTIIISSPVATTVTPAQIKAANDGVVLTVRRVDGENILTWTLPSGLPAEAQGVQIWRSNSPYALVATLTKGTTGFDAATYTDSSASAKATSNYLVTVFYGTTSALGFFTDATAPDTADYAGTAFSSGGGDDGIAWWVWALLGVAVLAIIVLVVILVLRRRGGDKGEQGGEGDEGWSDTPAAAPAPAAAAAAETHHLRCPACQTTFTANGSKPLVTVCPGCGRRGVLN